MLYTKLTVEAVKLAEKYHRNQVDKNGIPYIFHVVAVAENCKTEYAQCVGLLHDILEDTDCKLTELCAKFPIDIINAIILLTHKQNMKYIDYIKSIKNNPIAVEVKLSDIQNNTDPYRLSLLSIEQRNRLIQKYKEAKEILENY